MYLFALVDRRAAILAVTRQRAGTGARLGGILAVVIKHVEAGMW